MKVKVLTRDPADYRRETVSDIHKCETFIFLLIQYEPVLVSFKSFCMTAQSIFAASSCSYSILFVSASEPGPNSASLLKRTRICEGTQLREAGARLCETFFGLFR